MGYFLLDISVVLCALACLGLVKPWRRYHNGVPLPPGPKGLPLIGNLLDMPKEREWEAARKWGEQYGPIICVEILGTQYIFMNSYKSAVDLLEKRSSNYSSRPANAMLDLEGLTGWFTSVMPYGPEVRKQRKMMHRFLQPAAVGDFWKLQVHSTHKLLARLLRFPGNFSELARRFAGEVIMMATYGHKVADKADPFISIGEKGMAAFAEAEGFFLVNSLPWLRYLPTWLPGAGFQKIAKEGYKHTMTMKEKPHETMKKRMLDGEIVPSMWSKLMEANLGEDGAVKDEEVIAGAMGTVYGGGADSVVSASLTFLLAMVLHPDVQRRAQEELDRVIGENSLPSFEDRPSLPYVDAICKECLRWQPVGPLGSAHMATEDDEYNGYYIPAGATVFLNVWAMSRDPTVYPEPDKFIPERWLASSGEKLPLDSRKVVFSLGRRACPGRHLADNSIFIVIASILSVFNISKALDENGEPITPEVEYTPHFVSHPKPFKYSIQPRSAEKEKVIRRAVESAE